MERLPGREMTPCLSHTWNMILKSIFQGLRGRPSLSCWMGGWQMATITSFVVAFSMALEASCTGIQFTWQGIFLTIVFFQDSFFLWSCWRIRFRIFRELSCLCQCGSSNINGQLHLVLTPTQNIILLGTCVSNTREKGLSSQNHLMRSCWFCESKIFHLSDCIPGKWMSFHNSHGKQVSNMSNVPRLHISCIMCLIKECHLESLSIITGNWSEVRLTSLCLTPFSNLWFVGFRANWTTEWLSFFSVDNKSLWLIVASGYVFGVISSRERKIMQDRERLSVKISTWPIFVTQCSWSWWNV